MLLEIGQTLKLEPLKVPHAVQLRTLRTRMKMRAPVNYEGVSKSFRTGRLERELQMVKLSATRCSCIAIL
jgi:hypothetical protein